MAKTFNGKYEYDENGINAIIGEHNNTFLALREVKWFEDSDYKLDLRKYKTDEEKDTPLKGVTLTEEEADELTIVLLKEGYGDNTEIEKVLYDHRPDVVYEMGCEGYDQNPEDSRKRRLFIRTDGNTTDNEESENEENYYDPKEVL